MSEIKFEDMVANLCKDGEEVRKSLSSMDAHILHMCMGVIGEVGELVDAIKKSIIYGKPLDLENVVEEFGDIEFYMEGLRGGLSISRAATIEHNIKKLGKRYMGFKYTNDAAIARADKE